jgi:hypothetical protein
MNMALGVRIRTAAATILGSNCRRICITRSSLDTKIKETKKFRRGGDGEKPGMRELGGERWPLKVRNFSVELLRLPVSGLFRVT